VDSVPMDLSQTTTEEGGMAPMPSARGGGGGEKRAGVREKARPGCHLPQITKRVTPRTTRRGRKNRRAYRLATRRPFPVPRVTYNGRKCLRPIVGGKKGERSKSLATMAGEDPWRFGAEPYIRDSNDRLKKRSRWTSSSARRREKKKKNKRGRADHRVTEGIGQRGPPEGGAAGC